MTAPFLIDKETLYRLSEGIVTFMALIFGFHYLKQIIAFVLAELYRIFIQRGMLPL